MLTSSKLTLALIAPSLLLASTSFAAPPETDLAVVKAARPDWALGATLTLGSLGLSGLGGLGGLVAGEPAPGVVLERRLDDGWWLLAGVEGSYTNLGDDTAHSVHGRVGARWVADPDAPVRVAPTFTLVAGESRATHAAVGADDEDVESSALQLGVEAGLDLELAVTEGFALRLRTTLLSVRWSRHENTSGDDVTTLEGVTAALALRPTLAAMFRF